MGQGRESVCEKESVSERQGERERVRKLDKPISPGAQGIGVKQRAHNTVVRSMNHNNHLMVHTNNHTDVHPSVLTNSVNAKWTSRSIRKLKSPFQQPIAPLSYWDSKRFV